MQQVNRHFFRLHNEELAAIGAGTGVCHGQGAPVVAEFHIKLILKAVAPDGFAAGAVAIGVAALDHKVLNDPVEGQAVIVAFFGMGKKILYRFRSKFREETELNGAFFGFHNGNFGVFCRFFKLIHNECSFLIRSQSNFLRVLR